MSTIAEKIAAALHNDGQIFETDDGTSLDELLESAPGYSDSWRHGTMTVVVFADGSMIGRNDQYWDEICTVSDDCGRMVWIDSAEKTGKPWARLDDDGEPIGWDYDRI